MKISPEKSSKLDGTERTGLLIAHFGATAEIQDELGHTVYCHIRKNCEPVITGDNVLWQPEHDGKGIIVGCLPRKSLLARPEHKHKSKPVAANIDAIVIVGAPATFSEYLLDRYLIAAENLQIPPMILLNKIDLLSEANREELHQRLNVYASMGYPVIYSSIFTKHGLSDLEKFFRDKTSVLVGASGVGKSSIISGFVPQQIIMIGETSAKGIGKHTTTGTRLYHLPHGGKLIDSPGVREFSLWNINQAELLNGFIEFKKYLGQCKFRDCRHLKEPGCALQLAANNHEISATRLESYRKLAETLSTNI
jgi:ribosome biogenesis GTPase